MGRAYSLVGSCSYSPCPGELWPSHPWYRMLWEELLVAAFEDVHLGVVQAGVVVSCTVPFPDEAAPGAAWEEVQGRPHVRRRPCPVHTALRASKCTGFSAQECHLLGKPGY